MHSPKPSNLAFHCEVRWNKEVGNDRLSGLLQHLAVDPVCQIPPKRRHHTSFSCRRFHSHIGAAGETPEFDIKSPSWVPLLIFPRSYLLKSFPQGDTSARQRRLKSEFSISYVSFQRLSSLTCAFSSYTADNSVPTSGHSLRPSH